MKSLSCSILFFEYGEKVFDQYDRIILDSFKDISINSKYFLKVDNNQIQLPNSINYYTELKSDDVFHFVDNFSTFRNGSLENFNKHNKEIIVRVLIQPDEQFLYSKSLLLKFALNVKVELDFDQNLLKNNKYNLNELFYLEDCLYHLNQSFEDKSWLRIIPFESELVEDIMYNGIIDSRVNLLSDDFKRIIEHIKKRY